jgi:membrane-associated phospholipid phosphatase
VLKDGTDFLRIGGHLGAAPLHWRSHSWLLAGSIVGGTAASALLDDELDVAAQKNQTGTLDDLARIGEAYGDGKYIMIGTSVFYLTGLFTRDRWVRETAFLAGTATIYASLFTRIFKPLVGRARPYMDSGNHDFRVFNFHDDYNSFPSGHTVAAFAVSTVLARRIGNPFASVGLYGLATVTGLSRVYTQQHWVSDVVFGAAMSIVVANAVVDWYESGGEAGEEAGFRVMPAVGGITVVLNF